MAIPKTTAEVLACLRTMRPPVTKDEALDHAEACGADADLLDFLEALPAAVFSSKSGLDHVFAMLGRTHLEGPDSSAPPAEDGLSG